MVDQPWEPEAPEQLPPKAAADIRSYAKRFRYVRMIVSLQAGFSGVLWGSGCIWLGLFAQGDGRNLSTVFGIGMLALTLLSLFLIRSKDRVPQVFAYNFAQASNGFTLLCSVCGGMFSFEERHLTEPVIATIIVLGILAVTQVFGLVWMVRFHHQSLRIKEYRKSLKTAPKAGWEKSPWGNFEAPIETEDFEIDGGWDTGGANSGADAEQRNDDGNWGR